MKSLKQCLFLWVMISIGFLAISQMMGWMLCYVMSVNAMLIEKGVAVFFISSQTLCFLLFMKTRYSSDYRSKLWPWIKWEDMSYKTRRYYTGMGIWVFAMIGAIIDAFAGLIAGYLIAA